MMSRMMANQPQILLQTVAPPFVPVVKIEPGVVPVDVPAHPRTVSPLCQKMYQGIQQPLCFPFCWQVLFFLSYHHQLLQHYLLHQEMIFWLQYLLLVVSFFPLIPLLWMLRMKRFETSTSPIVLVTRGSNHKSPGTFQFDSRAVTGKRSTSGPCRRAGHHSSMFGILPAKCKW